MLIGRRELAIGIHLHSKGDLEISQVRWHPDVPARFPSQFRSCEKLARPEGETNDLLVVVREGWLWVYVNDQVTGPPIEHPEGLLPCEPQWAGFAWSDRASTVELMRFTLWDLENPKKAASPAPKATSQPVTKPVKLVQPADLAKREPLLDWNLSRDKRSPEFKNGDQAWESSEKFGYRSEYGEAGIVVHFDPLPAVGWRCSQSNEIGPLRNFAVRLSGRLVDGQQTSFSIVLLGGTDGKRSMAIHVHPDGTIETSQFRWQPTIPLTFPPRKASWKSLARPSGEPNELLVIVQEGRMRAFVNDQPVPLDGEVPDGVAPSRIQCAAFSWSPAASEVTLSRHTVWNLDDPVPKKASPGAPNEARELTKPSRSG